MDESKLTPAPWDSVGPCATLRVDEGPYLLVHDMKEVGRFQREDDCDAASLARKALDVMMRREWGICKNVTGMWIVTEYDDVRLWHAKREGGYFKDTNPFTALVEADKWYAANVESKSDA